MLLGCQKLKVIAMTQSPSFTVTSYRRACDRCRHISLEEPSSNSIGSNAIGCGCPFNNVYQVNCVSPNNSPATSIRPYFCVDALSLNYTIAKPSIAKSERNLVILWYYLSYAPMSCISDKIQSNMRIELPACEDDNISFFDIDSAIMQQIPAIITTTAMDSVNTLLVDLITWYFGVGGTELRNSIVFAHANQLTSKNQINQAYATWIDILTSKMTELLKIHGSSIDTLASDVLLLCNNTSELKHIASKIEEYIRKEPHNNGLVHYIAQLREVYMASRNYMKTYFCVLSCAIKQN